MPNWPEEGRYTLKWLREQSSAIVEAGYEFEDQLKALGIDPHTDKVSMQDACVLHALNAATVGDEVHLLGRHRIPLGTMAYAIRNMMTCRDLRRALQALQGFGEVVEASVKIQILEVGNLTGLMLACQGRDALSGALVDDINFAVVYACLAYFVGRRLPLDHLTYPLVDSPFMGRLHAAVRAPVRHGAEAALWFPTACLDWERKNPGGLDAFERAFGWYGVVLPRQLPVERLGLPVTPSLLRAQSALQMAPINAPGLLIPAEAGLSRATQHALAAALAVEYLIASPMTVGEIASRLGYSEASSFRRFLKSELGATPAEIRESWRLPGLIEDFPRFQNQVQKFEL